MGCTSRSTTRQVSPGARAVVSARSWCGVTEVDGRPCGVGSSVVCRGRGHFFLFCVLTFLKRQYTLHDDGSLTIQTHEKHITQLCSLLGLNVRNQNKKNPAHADIEKGDDTADFSSTSATGHNFQNLRWCFDVSGD